MKGISPMIAVVLLIAFTVAIGGVMSVWLTGLTNTQQQQVTNQSSAQIKCTPSLQIDIVKVPSGIGGYVNITFSNPSQQTISSLVGLVPNNNTALTLSQTSLSPGSVGTLTANVSYPPNFVKISGLCSGLPLEASCDSTQVCWG